MDDRAEAAINPDSPLSPARMLAVNGRFQREFALVPDELRAAVEHAVHLWIAHMPTWLEMEYLAVDRERARRIYTMAQTPIAIGIAGCWTDYATRVAILHAIAEQKRRAYE